MISAKKLREKMREDRNARIEEQMGKGSRAYKRMIGKIESGIMDAANRGEVSSFFQLNEDNDDPALVALVMDELEELGYNTEQTAKPTKTATKQYGILINWRTKMV